MTDQPKPTVEERIAERQAVEDELRARLADLQLDGPYDFARGLDPLTAMFGGARDRFAVCLRCGAMVVLNDPEKRTDSRPIERGVRIHFTWHEQLAAGR